MKHPRQKQPIDRFLDKIRDNNNPCYFDMFASLAKFLYIYEIKIRLRDIPPVTYESFS